MAQVLLAEGPDGVRQAHRLTPNDPPVRDAFLRLLVSEGRDGVARAYSIAPENRVVRDAYVAQLLQQSPPDIAGAYSVDPEHRHARTLYLAHLSSQGVAGAQKAYELEPKDDNLRVRYISSLLQTGPDAIETVFSKFPNDAGVAIKYVRHVFQRKREPRALQTLCERMTGMPHATRASFVGAVLGEARDVIGGFRNENDVAKWGPAVENVLKKAESVTQDATMKKELTELQGRVYCLPGDFQRALIRKIAALGIVLTLIVSGVLEVVTQLSSKYDYMRFVIPLGSIFPTALIMLAVAIHVGKASSLARRRRERLLRRSSQTPAAADRDGANSSYGVSRGGRKN